MAEDTPTAEEPKPKNKGGRPPGATTLKSRAVADGWVAQGKETPLEFLLKRMANRKTPMDERVEIAKACLPYMHPKLAAVEHSGSIATSHEDALAELE